MQQTAPGSSWRAVAAVSVTLAILWITPWYTGLFFAPASTIVTTAVALLSLLLLFPGTLTVSAKRPETWAMVYALYVALTNLWAADYTNSLLVTTGQVAALLFFVLMTRYADVVSRWIGYSLVFIGIALYVYGMGAGLGWWAFNDAVYNGHQLASVFQYHNTFAAIELAVAVIGYMVALPFTWSEHQWLGGWWMTIPGTLAIMTSMNAILASESRVVWVLTPFVAFFMIFGKARIDRTAWSWIRGTLTVVLGGATGFLAIKALSHPSAKYFVYSLVADLVLSVLIAWAEGYALRRRLTRRQWLIGSGAVVVVLAAVLYKLRGHLLGSAHTVTSRLGTISFDSVSLQERFYYYKNAVAIWLNAPFFGSGGGTWAAKYQAFQTLPYTSAQAHSTVVDVLLNGGLVGFALYVALLATALVWIVRYLRDPAAPATTRLTVMGFTLAALTLLVHSFLDFDFAFGYFQLLYWMLLGVATGISLRALVVPLPPARTAVEKRSERTRVQWSRAAAVSSWVLGIFAIAFGLSLTGYEVSSQAATQDATNGNAYGAYLQDQAASSLAPYNATSLLAVGQHLLSTATVGDQTTNDAQALQDAQAAAGLSKWNGTVQTGAALIAYQLRDDTQAVSFAEQAYQDARFNETDMRNLLGVSMWSYAGQLKTDPAAAKAGLRQVLALFAQYRAREHVINLHLFPGAVPLTEDVSMQVYVGTTRYLLGDYRGSLASMTPLQSTTGDPTAQELYMIDVVLDDNALHVHSSIAASDLKQIDSNAQAKQEYAYLQSL